MQGEKYKYNFKAYLICDSYKEKLVLFSYAKLAAVSNFPSFTLPSLDISVIGLVVFFLLLCNYYFGAYLILKTDRKDQ